MARKKAQEEHENHERWLVSYADFITLLFAFFVVMYAVSSVNEGKYRVLSDALVAAFRSSAKALQPIQVGSTAKSPETLDLEFRKTPVPIEIPKMPLPRKEEAAGDKRDGAQEQGDGPAPQDHNALGNIIRADQAPESTQAGAGKQEGGRRGLSEAESDIQALADDLEEAFRQQIGKDLVKVRRGKQWVEVELNTSIVFASGSAMFVGEAIPLLRELVAVIEPRGNPIRIEGYTDNVPIETEAFASNWELSAARAASVTHLFARLGIDAKRLAAIGYGENHPIADNATAAGRRRNRRVVIVLLTDAKATGDLEEARSAYLGQAADSAAGSGSREPARGLAGADGRAAGEPERAPTSEAEPSPPAPGITAPPIQLRPPVIISPEAAPPPQADREADPD